jgi:hypothetical protein
MAKGKRMKPDKGQLNKHIDMLHCGGFCSEDEHRICPECVDWGELKSRESLRRDPTDSSKAS